MIRVGFSHCSTKITKSRSANQLLSLKHLIIEYRLKTPCYGFRQKTKISRVRRSLARNGLLSADIVSDLIGLVKCNLFAYQTEYCHEDSTPTKTTSLKNVGLDEPKRSGAEYISAVRVMLSPLLRIVVSTADSTVLKEDAKRRTLPSSQDSKPVPVCRLKPMPIGWKYR